MDGPNVYTYVKQNPWSAYDPEGLSIWSDSVGYCQGIGIGASNTAKDLGKLALSVEPHVNLYQFATGQKTGIQQNFENGIATAKAGYSLATSSQARSDALIEIGRHVDESLKDPVKFGQLAFTVVTTAVTLGESGVALASKVKAGTSLVTTSAKVTEAASVAEVAAAEGGGLANTAKNVGAYVKSDAPAVQRTLPKDKNGILQPDVDAPHTQLGRSTKSHGAEPQAREWMYDDKGRLVPTRDIDFTDHNMPSIHPNPHQHTLLPANPNNPVGGGFHRGDPEPLN